MPEVLLAVAQLVAKAPPIAVAPHIHPVPRPALPVPRIIQQALHQLLIRLGALVIFKGADFLRTRRQPQQIERQAPQKHPTRYFRLRGQPVRLALLRDEGIQRISHPARIGHDRHRWAHAWPEGPMILRIGLGLFLRRSCRARCDPLAQQLHLRGRKRLAFMQRRHPLLGIILRDTLDQQAPAWLASHQDIARFATLQHQLYRVQPQPGLLFQRPVASVAAPTQ